MSEKMYPIPFDSLMNWVTSEYAQCGDVFGVHKHYHASGKSLPIFGERIETPFGPAAGPNSQLAQNIIAAYAAGARFFEVKTVQKMDGEELARCVPRPCILAADEGYNVIVMPGYAFGGAIVEAAPEFPDVKFIALDVAAGDLLETAVAKAGESYDFNPSNWDLNKYVDMSNVYCAVYQEELCGYMAGYAAVKLGYKNLGFLGGMAVPAVIRYGYGFVQGADAAAQELGQNIDINYFYGGQFYGDANITSRMEGWYSNGTQVVFACGGGIYTSAVEAALKNNGYVIGVDVDQNYIGANGVADGTYAYNPFITSAMKGLSEAVSTSLSDIEAGEWSTIAATNGNFGLEDGDYVGLPTDEDSWNFETFTVEEYEELKQKIASGEIVVDNSSDDATKPTVSEFTNVTYIQ